MCENLYNGTTTGLMSPEDVNLNITTIDYKIENSSKVNLDTKTKKINETNKTKNFKISEKVTQFSKNLVDSMDYSQEDHYDLFKEVQENDKTQLRKDFFEALDYENKTGGRALYKIEGCSEYYKEQRESRDSYVIIFNDDKLFHKQLKYIKEQKELGKLSGSTISLIISQFQMFDKMGGEHIIDKLSMLTSDFVETFENGFRAKKCLKGTGIIKKETEAVYNSKSGKGYADSFSISPEFDNLRNSFMVVPYNVGKKYYQDKIDGKNPKKPKLSFEEILKAKADRDGIPEDKIGVFKVKAFKKKCKIAKKANKQMNEIIKSNENEIQKIKGITYPLHDMNCKRKNIDFRISYKSKFKEISKRLNSKDLLISLRAEVEMNELEKAKVSNEIEIRNQFEENGNLDEYNLCQSLFKESSKLKDEITTLKKDIKDNKKFMKNVIKREISNAKVKTDYVYVYDTKRSEKTLREYHIPASLSKANRSIWLDGLIELDLVNASFSILNQFSLSYKIDPKNTALQDLVENREEWFLQMIKAGIKEPKQFLIHFSNGATTSISKERKMIENSPLKEKFNLLEEKIKSIKFFVKKNFNNLKKKNKWKFDYEDKNIISYITSFIESKFMDELKSLFFKESFIRIHDALFVQEEYKFKKGLKDKIKALCSKYGQKLSNLDKFS